MANTKQRDAVQEILTNSELQPWDRLPRETLKAFQAFVLFRSLDKRGLTPVAKELNCTVQNVFKWSAKYDWNERARQWDIFNDRLAQQEEIKERGAMRKRFIAQGVAMQNVAAHGLTRYTDAIKVGSRIILSPTEITTMFEKGSQMEQLGRGDPSQGSNVVFEVTIGPVDEEEMKLQNRN